MPYKFSKDLNANRRLKRPHQRIRRWAAMGFDFVPPNKYVRCRLCGKVTYIGSPAKNRHSPNCKSLKEQTA